MKLRVVSSLSIVMFAAACGPSTKAAPSPGEAARTPVTSFEIG